MNIHDATAAMTSAIGEPLDEVKQSPDKDFIFEAMAGDKRYVLKVKQPHLEPGRVAAEAWAYERLKDLGVPSVEIVHVHKPTHEDPSEYMVMEHVTGVPLEQSSLSLDDQLRVIEHLGQLLSRIHSVELEGYGWVDSEHFLKTAEIKGRSEAWSPMVQIALDEGLPYVVEHELIEQAGGDRIRSYIEEHSSLLAGRPRSAFLHGDLGANHVYVDGGNITAIIDFMDMHIGDPVWDIARFGLFESDERVAALLRGYGPTGEDFELKMKGYQLAYGVVGTYWGHLSGAGFTDYVLEYSGIKSF